MPILFSSDNGRSGAALFRSVPVTSLAVSNAFIGCLFLNVLASFKHWDFIASRQLASQTFMFNVSGTLSAFSLGILVPRGRASFGADQKARRNAFPVAKLSLHSTCSSEAGGGITFGTWRSMYFCDVCPVHHIWINYFVTVCMIYESSSARV